MSLAQHQGLEAPHLPADLVLRRRHGGQLGVYGDDAVKRPFWRRPDHLRIDLRDHSGVGGGREEGKEREKTPFFHSCIGESCVSSRRVRRQVKTTIISKKNQRPPPKFNRLKKLNEERYMYI